MPTKPKYVVALHSTSAELTEIFPFGSLALTVMPHMLAEDDSLELHFMNGPAFVQHFKPVDGAFPYFIEKQVNVVMNQPDTYMLVVMSTALAARVERDYFPGHKLPHLMPRNLMRPTSVFEPTKNTHSGTQAVC